MNPGTPAIFSAVRLESGEVRRLWFEAPDEAKGRQFCVSHGFGYTGMSGSPETREQLPEAYDEKTARRLLGGISRSTLYKELVLGLLERAPDTGRKLLVTRGSIESRYRR